MTETGAADPDVGVFTIDTFAAVFADASAVAVPVVVTVLGVPVVGCPPTAPADVVVTADDCCVTDELTAVTPLGLVVKEMCTDTLAEDCALPLAVLVSASATNGIRIFCKIKESTTTVVISFLSRIRHMKNKFCIKSNIINMHRQ
jgi:hypothetical protein